MPSWHQLQGQVRSPNNPIVFMDINIGETVKMANLRPESEVHNVNCEIFPFSPHRRLGV